MLMKMARHFPGLLMKTFRRIMSSSGGFTLIEMLVSITIMVIVTGIFGAAMFQVFGIQRYWTDDIKATRTTRHAASWFAGDALNATRVLVAPGGISLVCGDPPVQYPEVTLEWTGSDGDSHFARYYLGGPELDVLYRSTDLAANPLTMTTGVEALAFTLCQVDVAVDGGYTLRAMMDVASDRDNVETLDLVTYIRKLDPA